MRIALVSETFTRGMGYTENLLPRALARLGNDVHVIASDLQAYFNLPTYRETYEPFLGPARQPVGSEDFGDFTLHRLPHRLLGGYVALPGLGTLIGELGPALVQTGSVANWVAMQAALLGMTRR